MNGAESLIATPYAAGTASRAATSGISLVPGLAKHTSMPELAEEFAVQAMEIARVEVAG